MGSNPNALSRIIKLLLTSERISRTARTEENIELIRLVAEGQETSVRKISKLTGVTKSSTHNILKHDLKLRPYRLRLVQQLSEEDMANRVFVCQDLLEQRVVRKPELAFFSDEANFYTDGHVNRYNCVIYDYARPDGHIVSRDLSAKKICVWGALSSTKIIGPYFFEGNVNAESYCRMLTNYAIPEIRSAVGERKFLETYFMQDGAPAHYSIGARNVIKEAFGNRCLGRGLPIHWPSRSPDLTPADYFLWGFIKELVYKNETIATVGDLKDKIRDAFVTLRLHHMDYVGKAVRSFEVRLQQCIALNGAQLGAVDRVHEE